MARGQAVSVSEAAVGSGRHTPLDQNVGLCPAGRPLATADMHGPGDHALGQRLVSVGCGMAGGQAEGQGLAGTLPVMDTFLPH